MIGIFDFDGVIKDTLKLKGECFFYSLLARNLILEKDYQYIIDYHLQNAGVSRQRKFDHFCEKYKFPDIQIKPLMKEFEEQTYDEIKSLSLIGGIEKILEHFDLSYICTAMPHETINRLLKDDPKLKYFYKAYGFPMTKVAIVNEILDEHQNERLIYFGDSMQDLVAASSIDIFYCHRVHSYNHRLIDAHINFTNYDEITLEKLI